MIMDEVLDIIRHNPGVTFRDLRHRGIPQRFGTVLPALCEAGILRRYKVRSPYRTGRMTYAYEIMEVKEDE